jgi:ferredoxin
MRTKVALSHSDHYNLRRPSKADDMHYKVGAEMVEGRTLLVCSCENTMPLDADALRRGCHGAQVTTANQLCRAEMERFRTALANQADVVVGCTQEAPLFREVAGERGALSFVNVRENAGWSKDAASAGPKMAALLSVAAEPSPSVPYISLQSGGVALIYGRDESAIEAGRLLADHLDVTVLIASSSQGLSPARVNEVPIVQGAIRSAKGHLGAFEVTVDGYAQPDPSSRGGLTFGASRNGAVSRCDLVLDLSGGAPLFPASDLRDGYLRADPGDKAAVLRAVLRARDLTGTFEKPRYITFTEGLCAHSRSNIVGCHRCLDVCPAGAIAPNGDHVAVDANICAGCGQCATSCPSGGGAY